MEGATKKFSSKGSVLGRGLGALLSPSPVDLKEMAVGASDSRRRPTSERESAGELMRFVEPSRLRPGALQPRRDFPEEEIESLARSLSETGLLQPILVRRLSGASAERGDADAGVLYEIVAGERRWRAAKRASLEKVPIILREFSDKESLEIGIIENVQRQNLNPIEEAWAYKRLIEDFGSSQKELAKVVGKDRASVSNSLRLLSLCEELQGELVRGSLSAGHARALLSLPSQEQRRELAGKIAAEGLSVRAVERMVSRLRVSGGGVSDLGEGSPRASTSLSADSEGPNCELVDCEDRLRRLLGLRVNLSLRRSGAGSLKIAFSSSSELGDLLAKLESSLGRGGDASSP